MRTKEIISRATSKSLIPTLSRIRKPTSKEKKGYLKKPEFTRIVDSIKINGTLIGSVSNPNNASYGNQTSSKSSSNIINGNVGSNVPITPCKTRTGKVYCRLSTVFAHKIPRLSQQLPSTPLTKKLLKNTETSPPNSNQESSEASTETTTKKILPSLPVLPFLDLTPKKLQTSFALVTEEEIHHSFGTVPNLEDIAQPAPLICFDSTMNDSFDVNIDKQDANSNAEEVAEIKEDKVVAEQPNLDESIIFLGVTSPSTHIMSSEKPEEKVNNVDLVTEEEPQEMDESPLRKRSARRRTMGGKNFSVKSLQSGKSAVELEEASTTTVNSLQDFSSLDTVSEKLEPCSLFEKLEVADGNAAEVKEDEVVAEDLDESSVCIGETSPFTNAVPPIKNEEKSNDIELPAEPESQEMDESPVRKRYARRKTMGGKNLTIKSLRTGRSLVELLEAPTTTVNSYRDLSSSIDVLEKLEPCSSSEKLDDSSTAVNDSCSSTNIAQSAEDSNEMLVDSPNKEEASPKKGKGGRKKGGNKKQLSKSSPRSEKSSAESSSSSSSTHIVDGIVYASIPKSKNGKRIPLTIRVDATLLIEPKESCLKKEKNQSGNGGKRFRWADWVTKNIESLTQIQEFTEAPETYGLRTKGRKHKDPYDE